MIKSFIFDLDGVIVDTAKYHYIAWKALANKLGFDFTEEHNERLKGVSRMTSLEILLEIGAKKISLAEKQKLADQKNKNYRKYILQMQPDEILPGVEKFLRHAKEMGFRLAIGSASKNASTILERINLSDYFDIIVDGNMITAAKPNPEVFLKGAEGLQTDPAACVVFEDSFSGIEAAINAKMFAVGVGSPKILHQAHHIIPGFQNISVQDVLTALDNIK